ncbi:hypothetical protein CIRG_00602 [Coccidioides immitis RMSCC 2394]|uniref:Uncharacterized protein n=1 Tax=Coccidioides immitis RMSCC 2394 TaxID=404692 RepID=A0A0J6Y095_COCIT|nr:hypothetical protein CIRG_00602 [Coccidioides immitis RMSCC 2394]
MGTPSLPKDGRSLEEQGRLAEGDNDHGKERVMIYLRKYAVGFTPAGSPQTLLVGENQGNHKKALLRFGEPKEEAAKMMVWAFVRGRGGGARQDPVADKYNFVPTVDT